MSLTTEFNEDKIKLVRDTICKGSTSDELQLFVHACRRTGLDPFMRQIHAVKRWDSTLKREAMAIQVGIDGYRLVAERTGRYAPGKDTSYVYDSKDNLLSATAYVKKQTQDGTWHEIAATAFFTEYCAYIKDKNSGETRPNTMWTTKKHIMLSKCAESLALRKAFPAELSGIYTSEEMEQADNPKIEDLEEAEIETPKVQFITRDQADELYSMLAQCDYEDQKKILELSSRDPHNAKTLEELPVNIYEKFKAHVIRKRDEFLKASDQEFGDGTSS